MENRAVPPNLSAWVREAGGVLPVRRFMERALYDPQSGYYTAHVRTVGRRGDFSTSATLGTALGRAVARWLLAELELDRAAHPFHLALPCPVVEVGAGDGSLADVILRSLGFRGRRRLRYHIVESSPVLTEVQQRRLGRRRVRWSGTVGEALDACGSHAVVISNELVDAFPCDVYEWDGQCWQEVVLVPGRQAGAIREAVRPAANLPGSSALDPARWPDAGLKAGQRVEAHASFREWLEEWVPNTGRLTLLTIDYGDTFPQLYHRRPSGTFRAYAHHRRLDGPEAYHRPGHQDLTADVNFTDLQVWGQTLGLKTDRLDTQTDFVARYTGSETTDGTLDPDGAGSAFKVLVQRKG